jgi:hypothetical protein
MKIIKRIGLLVLFSLLGAIVFVFLAKASSKGLFVKWESLGKPPEKAVQVVNPGYVKTDTGEIYRYNFQQGCNVGCWEKIDTLPLSQQTYWPLSSCGSLPPLDNYVNTKAVCKPWGVGSSLEIYAIGKDGFVYYWNRLKGEGDSLALLYSPFIGAAVGFVFGIVVLIVVLYRDLIKWLQKRAQEKGVVNKA